MSITLRVTRTSVGFCICVFTQRVTCMNILKKTCSREHDIKFSELFELVTQNNLNYSCIPIKYMYMYFACVLNAILLQ